MSTEILELKRTLRAKDLAYLAGKKRQSPRTGFVHLFSGNASEEAIASIVDTIPIYENFCFVLALLFQKKSDAVAEAKRLLSRLVDFQVDHFPIYLHDFPHCYDFYLGLKILPLLLRIQSFKSVLGEAILEKMDGALRKIFFFYEGKECAPLWAFRLAVCHAFFTKSPFPSYRLDTTSFLAADWWEYWISLQFIETPVCDFYHSKLQMAIGVDREQERFEPAPQLIDWISSEEYLPHLLQDRPAHLHLVALDRIEICPIHTSDLYREGTDVYWKGLNENIHSLIAEKGQNVFLPDPSKESFIVTLPPIFEMGRDDLFEVAFYCDASPDISFWIDGKKGTVFQPGQTITIHSSTKQFSIIFEVLRGEGEFCGHIFRSNRPNQIASSKDRYEAFDWKIGLRTLRRSSDCTIRILR